MRAYTQIWMCARVGVKGVEVVWKFETTESCCRPASPTGKNAKSVKHFSS